MTSIDANRLNSSQTDNNSCSSCLQTIVYDMILQKEKSPKAADTLIKSVASWIEAGHLLNFTYKDYLLLLSQPGEEAKNAIAGALLNLTKKSVETYEEEVRKNIIKNIYILCEDAQLKDVNKFLQSYIKSCTVPDEETASIFLEILEKNKKNGFSFLDVVKEHLEATDPDFRKGFAPHNKTAKLLLYSAMYANMYESTLDIQEHLLDNFFTEKMVEYRLSENSMLQKSELEKPALQLAKWDVGMFACVITVLGMVLPLEEGDYSGVDIDFGTSGYYYDKQHGPNWWEYFFEPIHFPKGKKFEKKKCRPPAGCTGYFNREETIQVSFDRGWYLARLNDAHKANGIMKKYIKVKKEYQDLCTFIIKDKDHLRGKPYIGVHFRGTDKQGSESTILSAEEMVKKIAEKIDMSEYSDHLIYVATDEKEFIDLMKKKYGELVVISPTQLPKKKEAIHLSCEISGYQKGKEAIVDCLVLAQSRLFLGTESNLDNVVLIMSPDLPYKCFNSVIYC